MQRVLAVIAVLGSFVVGCSSATTLSSDGGGSSGGSGSTGSVISPPLGADEPSFDAGGQTLLFKDDFDGYGSFGDAVDGGWRCSNGAATQDTSTNPNGACQVVSPGYDGTGRAIRLVYDGAANAAGQEGHSWDRPSMPDALAAMPGHTFYMSYYFRINTGGGATLDQDAEHIVKVKWLELWDTTDRAQFSTSYSTCDNDVPFAGASGSGTMWDFFARGGGNTTCNAGQVRAPFAYQGAGQWHRLTHRYVTQSATGARDGAAQLWYDGTLIVSVAQGYCGVPVPDALGVDGHTGEVQNWCENADLDQFFVQQPIHNITLGSVSTSALWPFAIDYDHMIMWRD